MSLINELREYQKQQLNNDMLSEYGIKTVNLVIEQCIKNVQKNTKWNSPDKPPNNNRDVLILYKEKEPFDDEPLIGQAVSRWQEITFGGNRTGKYQFSPPFNYFIVTMK